MASGKREREGRRTAGVGRKGGEGWGEAGGASYVFRRGPSRVRCRALRLRGAVAPLRGILRPTVRPSPSTAPGRLRTRFRAFRIGNRPNANSPEARANPLQHIDLDARSAREAPDKMRYGKD